MSYSDCNTMPGIIAVKWLHAEQLPSHIIEKFIAGISSAIGNQGNDLELVDVGSAEGIRSYENNGLIGKATLEFKTLDQVPRDEDIVWAVQDADENWWLMGARERPDPVVEVSQSTGTPSGDPAVATVKVTHTAKIALIPVAL